MKLVIINMLVAASVCN